jgi:hypothetical protein
MKIANSKVSAFQIRNAEIWNLQFPLDYESSLCGLCVSVVVLEVAAGFEVRAVGAHQLAFLLIQSCPAVRAGPFDLFDL